MRPGQVLVDNEFPYDDGGSGKKIFIILNESETSNAIVIKTTSRAKFKGSIPGCQLRDNPQNFYLPAGSCGLDGETWVLLKTIEYELPHFIAREQERKAQRLFVLPIGILKKLFECVLGSYDVKLAHKTLIQDTLARL